MAYPGGPGSGVVLRDRVDCHKDLGRMMKGNNKLFDRFSEEFPGEMDNQPVIIESDALTMWCVASSIQLACRHPKNTGPTAHIAEVFARKIFDQIATTPALKEVAEKGWNPDFDESWKEHASDTWKK